jgi:hypothetical protein
LPATSSHCIASYRTALLPAGVFRGFFAQSAGHYRFTPTTYCGQLAMFVFSFNTMLMVQRRRARVHTHHCHTAVFAAL